MPLMRPTGNDTSRREHGLRGWRPVLIRALIPAGGWWVISDGDRSALAFGLPVVSLALGASLLIGSPRSPRWSPIGLVRYGVAFLLGSLHGGIDVARRALAPRLRISPRIVRYRLRLASGPARRLFMGTLNLLPGTLSVNLDGDDLEVHTLVDKGDALVAELQAIESHVARAVGEPLEGRHA